MTEKFESEFHKRYVGGEGEVEEKPVKFGLPSTGEIRLTTLEDLLAEYRWYLRDPNAQLPEEVERQFLAIHGTENDREE